MSYLKTPMSPQRFTAGKTERTRRSPAERQQGAQVSTSDKNPAALVRRGKIGGRRPPLGKGGCPPSAPNQLVATTWRVGPSGALAATVLASPKMRAVAKSALNTFFIPSTPKSKRGEKLPREA